MTEEYPRGGIKCEDYLPRIKWKKDREITETNILDYNYIRTIYNKGLNFLSLVRVDKERKTIWR
jgi:hypothetical protein